MKKYKGFRGDTARAQWWDYRNNAPYFITICTKDNIHHFGECQNGIMKLSAIGAITQGFWYEIPKHFPYVTLGEFQVMPNHIHGVLILNKSESQLDKDMLADVETLHRNVSTNPDKHPYFSDISPKSGSLSTIIRSYKSTCTKIIKKAFPESGFSWQTRFHDHIIRDEEGYEKIANYIKMNPLKWVDDKYYTHVES